MMEKEIIESYYFAPSDFNHNGRRLSDGKTFRDIVKDFERDFHFRHSTEYALNLYGSTHTMILLSKSCDAAPFLTYGMDLTQGRAFDAEKDPFINHQMDIHSKKILVYGIDSAYMDKFDKNGYPIIEENSGIHPLTLLIDDKMPDNIVKLAVPTTGDDDESDLVTIDTSKFEYA